MFVCEKLINVDVCELWISLKPRTTYNDIRRATAHCCNTYYDNDYIMLKLDEIARLGLKIEICITSILYCTYDFHCIRIHSASLMFYYIYRTIQNSNNILHQAISIYILNKVHFKNNFDFQYLFVELSTT